MSTSSCLINKVQQNDLVNSIMNLEPLAKRWESFGWEVADIDGHDFDQLKDAFDKFNATKGKPFAIISNTIKGKGVSFMEGNKSWHGKAPDDEKLKEALEVLK